MLITVDKLRKFVDSPETDEALAERLSGLESLIRVYTRNDFRDRNLRQNCDIRSGKIILDVPWLAVGDTIQITNSRWNGNIYVVEDISNGEITVDDDNLLSEVGVLVSKVVYPHDVVMGVINLMQWQTENADKAGISSETISRHSVTYENSTDSVMGYPRSLMSFLLPYHRARF